VKEVSGFKGFQVSGFRFALLLVIRRLFGERGFRFQRVSGFRFQVSGFRFALLLVIRRMFGERGFRFQGSSFKVSGFKGFQVSGSRCFWSSGGCLVKEVSGFKFQGFRFQRVSGFRFALLLVIRRMFGERGFRFQVSRFQVSKGFRFQVRAAFGHQEDIGERGFRFLGPVHVVYENIEDVHFFVWGNSSVK